MDTYKGLVVFLILIITIFLYIVISSGVANIPFLEPDSPVHILSKEEFLTSAPTPAPLDSSPGVLSQLQNAPNVITSCRKGNALILVFIHSSPSHFLHRTLYRETIGTESVVNNYKWTTVFFLGASLDPLTVAQVQNESSLYKDIVVLPYIDTYRNLTYKFVYGMRWVLQHCPQTKVILKIDDDMFVHLNLVDDYIKPNLILQKQDAFHCVVYVGMNVIREEDSPWYVSKEMYPRDTYPTYCSGRVVMFQSRLLQFLYSASLRKPFYPIDDTYVTGDLAVALHLGHKDIDDKVTYKESKYEEIVKGKYMFAHYSGIAGVEARRKIWYEMIKKGTLRIPEPNTRNFQKG